MRQGVFACVLVIAGLAASASVAAPTYITVDIPQSLGTSMNSINKSGVSIGIYIDQTDMEQGFIRAADGTITFLPQGAEDSVPDAIDRRGDVTGQTDGSGFLRMPDGTTVGFNPGSDTIPAGLNDHGLIAGFYYDANDLVHGFIRKKNGKIKAFEVHGAGTAEFEGTFAYGLNEAGAVSGVFIDGANAYHGFVRDPQGKTATFDVPGAVKLTGAVIAGDGTVVGTYVDANGVNHGFVRATDGTVAAFDAKGAGQSASQGTVVEVINDSGIASGTLVDSNGVSHGFLRSAKGKVVVFDDPLAGNASGQGTFSACVGPDNTIVGGYMDENFKVHGYIRTP